MNWNMWGKLPLVIIIIIFWPSGTFSKPLDLGNSLSPFFFVHFICWSVFLLEKAKEEKSRESFKRLSPLVLVLVQQEGNLRIVSKFEHEMLEMIIWRCWATIFQSCYSYYSWDWEMKPSFFNLIFSIL